MFSGSDIKSIVSSLIFDSIVVKPSLFTISLYDIYSNEEFDHDAGESYEESAEGNNMNAFLYIFSVGIVRVSFGKRLNIDRTTCLYNLYFQDEPTCF